MSDDDYITGAAEVTADLLWYKGRFWAMSLRGREILNEDPDYSGPDDDA